MTHQHTFHAARRDFLRAIGLGIAAAALPAATLLPRGLRAQSSAQLITKAIPRTGERVPAIGLGTFLTFDLLPGQNRDPLREVMRRFWDGGGRYGALRDANAAAEQAEARRQATERAGHVDVARTRRQVEVADQSRALAQKALEQAEKVDALTRKAFDAGLGTSLELVTAASALRQQQLNLALREYDVLRARVVALFALADCPP